MRFFNFERFVNPARDAFPVFGVHILGSVFSPTGRTEIRVEQMQICRKTRLSKSIIVPWENYLHTVFVGQFRKGVAHVRVRTSCMCVGSSSICLLHVTTNGKGPMTISERIETQTPDDSATTGKVSEHQEENALFSFSAWWNRDDPVA